MTKLTNVRKLLEFIAEWTKDMLERDGKYIGGLVLAPIDKAALCEINLLSNAILRKAKAKKTRKDIYISTKT